MGANIFEGSLCTSAILNTQQDNGLAVTGGSGRLWGAAGCQLCKSHGQVEPWQSTGLAGSRGNRRT